MLCPHFCVTLHWLMIDIAFTQNVESKNKDINVEGKRVFH